jgi:hypothetical protein
MAKKEVGSKFGQRMIDAESLGTPFLECGFQIKYFGETGTLIADRYVDENVSVESFFVTPHLLSSTLLDLGVVKAGYSLLDVGAGAGSICRLARSHGMVVTASELDPSLQKRLLLDGVSVVQTTDAIQSKRFDTIVVAGGGIPVVGQMIEPESAVSALLEFLEPTGRLVIDLHWVEADAPDGAEVLSVVPVVDDVVGTGACMSMSPNRWARTLKRLGHEVLKTGQLAVGRGCRWWTLLQAPSKVVRGNSNTERIS